MTKYRLKKVFDAIQVDGTSAQDDEIREWSKRRLAGHWSSTPMPVVQPEHSRGQAHALEYYVETAQGRKLARLGDYITLDEQANLNVVKRDYFEETYEPA